jgi:hypothetical protein
MNQNDLSESESTFLRAISSRIFPKDVVEKLDVSMVYVVVTDKLNENQIDKLIIHYSPQTSLYQISKLESNTLQTMRSSTNPNVYLLREGQDSSQYDYQSLSNFQDDLGLVIILTDNKERSTEIMRKYGNQDHWVQF